MSERIQLYVGSIHLFLPLLLLHHLIIIIIIWLIWIPFRVTWLCITYILAMVLNSFFNAQTSTRTFWTANKKRLVYFFFFTFGWTSSDVRLNDSTYSSSAHLKPGHTALFIFCLCVVLWHFVWWQNLNMKAFRLSCLSHQTHDRK